ncbi:MFS transporter [Myxococcota bacterium]|nr:MFS transporter [Myxococcota bacterium]
MAASIPGLPGVALSGLALSKSRVAAFASPSAALSGVGIPITVYMPAYYASDLGLGLAAVGAAFMLAKLWDVVTDPVAGIVTDNVRTRWGRRRLWVAVGTPIMFASAILIYFPERIHPDGITQNYLLLGLIGLYAGYTLVTISITSWGAELSTNYHRRSQIQGAIAFAGLFGNLVLLSLPALLELFDDATVLSDRMEIMGLFVVIALPLTTVIALTFVPEPNVPPTPPIGLRRAFQTVAANRHMVRLLVVDLLLSFPSSVRGVVYIFIIGHVIQRPDWTSGILVLYMIVNVIAVPAWVRISKYTGKHKAVAAGLLGHGVFALAYLLPGPGDIALFVGVHLVSAFVYGGHSFLIRSMVADVTDVDTLASGQQRAGLFYSLVTMTNKIGMALGIGIAYPVLDWIGFDPAGNNDPTAINGLRYLFVLTPFVAEMMVAWIIYHYQLDEKAQQEIRSQLEQADQISEDSPTER